MTPAVTVVGGITGALLLSSGAVLACGAFHPRSRLFGPVIWRGDTNQRAVALTFDDGPCPGVTERILTTLRDRDARATFFVIGRHARAHPDLLRRIHDEGHCIGNHTMDHHRTGLFRRDAYWRDQLARCADAVADVTGQPPRYFRPPMGFTSAHVARACRANDCTCITWTRRALDTIIHDPQRVTRRVCAGLAPGDIIALHDAADAPHRPPPAHTAEALPAILDGLAGADLRPARLDDLIAPLPAP